MLSRLIKIAEEFNVAIYLTNQVQSDPGAGMTFVADPKKPVGGHILVPERSSRSWQYLCLPHESLVLNILFIQLLNSRPMHPPRVCTFGKAEARNGSPRFMTALMFPKRKHVSSRPERHGVQSIILIVLTLAPLPSMIYTAYAISAGGIVDVS